MSSRLSLVNGVVVNEAASTECSRVPVILVTSFLKQFEDLFGAVFVVYPCRQVLFFLTNVFLWAVYLSIITLTLAHPSI